MDQALLTKKEFVDIINRLKETTELQDKVNQIFRDSRENVEGSNLNAGSLQISHESIVIDLLQKIMGDTAEDYPDISYFIYDLDYGKLYKHGSVTGEGGKIIDFSTAEKLYDYLVESNF